MDKYSQVYTLLKKKVKPDCARLIVYMVYNDELINWLNSRPLYEYHTIRENHQCYNDGELIYPGRGVCCWVNNTIKRWNYHLHNFWDAPSILHYRQTHKTIRPLSSIIRQYVGLTLEREYFPRLTEFLLMLDNVHFAHSCAERCELCDDGL